MIKGYIFDYGGTLDTAGCHWGKMIWHAYERQHIPVQEQDFRDAYVYAERTLGKNPIIQTDYTFHRTLDIKLRLEMEWLGQQQKWTAPARTVKQGHDRVLADLYAQVQDITAHSKAVLTELAARYPLVLVSNFYGNVGVVLHEFGFDGLFKQIVESAVVGVRKPDPRIYQLGVEALGLQPGEVVVVGDSFKKDILPAHAVGCHTVWFKGEGWTDEKYDETIPDRIITDLVQILK